MRLTILSALVPTFLITVGLVSCVDHNPLSPRVPASNLEEAKTLRAPFGDTKKAPSDIVAEGKRLYRYDLIRNEQQGVRTVSGNYNNVDSHTWMIRYYIHQSARTDIAWHTEYNWFRTRATGTNGSDVVGQLFFTGFDFAL